MRAMKILRRYFNTSSLSKKPETKTKKDTLFSYINQTEAPHALFVIQSFFLHFQAPTFKMKSESNLASAGGGDNIQIPLSLPCGL